VPLNLGLNFEADDDDQPKGSIERNSNAKNFQQVKAFSS
jgi:hypothetical protein